MQKLLVVLLLLLSALVLVARAEVSQEEREAEERRQVLQLQEFQFWLRDQGATVSDSIDIQSIASASPGQRGLFATGPLSDKTQVASIPLSLHLNAELANSHEELGAAVLEREWLTDWMALVALVVREQVKPHSFWRHYFAVVPKRVSTSPLLYSAEQRAALEGTAAHRQLQQLLDSLQEQYELVAPFIQQYSLNPKGINPPPPRRFPFEAFLELCSVLNSRLHSIRLKDADGNWQYTQSLIPLVDMLNVGPTEADTNVMCGTNADSTHFECVTTRAVAAGEQLLTSYGRVRAANPQLFLMYGLTRSRVNLNPAPAGADVGAGEPGRWTTAHDAVEVMPADVWSFLSLHTPTTELCRGIWRAPSAAQPLPLPEVDTLRPLRFTIGVLPQRQIGALVQAGLVLGSASATGSPEVDREVRRDVCELEVIVEYLEHLRTAHPTTIAQDEALYDTDPDVQRHHARALAGDPAASYPLDASGHDVWLWNVLNVRMGEKTVLETWQRRLRAGLQQLYTDLSLPKQPAAHQEL